MSMSLSNSLLLFLAGQDTTSSALSVTSHFLAKNQDLQEILYQEIKDAIDENDGDPNLGKIQIGENPLFPHLCFGGDNEKKNKSDVLSYSFKIECCESCELTFSTQSWKNTFVGIITDTIYLYLVGKNFHQLSLSLFDIW